MRETERSKNFREIARIQSIDYLISTISRFCINEGLSREDTKLAIETAMEDLKRKRGWAKKIAVNGS